MSIDWSKAPEGATHWEPRSDEYREAWMKNVADKWFFWGSRRKAWIEDPGISAEREATFEARPQEPWNGQGLPPVGTVCEYKYTHWPEYHQCEIRYISAASLIVYDHGQEQYYRTCDMLFRPLLTPEQIAAEERSKECDRIFVILSSVEREGNRSDMAEALYDAGYRRQEEGK
ncbi:hypothetical protein ACNATH_14285 [Pseudomonas aeruginosa]|uniref:hypothetical protein n=1 Tax=Pseudomonas aeruginosa TaxID=287 RepID=UPI003A4E180B